MNTRWHDLIIDRLEDGSIHLEQSAGVEEPNVIHLHPEQILFVARRLCGMKPETAEKVADLERRISVLTDRLQNLVCNSTFRGDLLEGTETGFEYIAKLDGLLDLALEFDGGRLEPEEAYSQPTQLPATAAKADGKATRANLDTPVTTADSNQLGLAV